MSYSRLIHLCERTLDPIELPSDALRQCTTHLREIGYDIEDDHERQNLIKSIALFSLHDDKEIADLALDAAAKLIWMKGTDQGNANISYLISELKPLLLRSAAMGKHSAPGLNPRLGFTYAEDQRREAWRERGGMKSIPIFYVILRNLPRSDVTSNLGWIVPGLLNILDDTSDFVRIKLKGVVLLRTFLEFCFLEDDTKVGESGRYLSLRETGVASLFEPTLTNMCYYLIEVNKTDNKETLELVYGTLLLLYERTYLTGGNKEDNAKNLSLYKEKIGTVILSEILLQYALPKIGTKDEYLLGFIIQMLQKMTAILGPDIVIYLQRIIYYVGEYVIRDPFFTSIRSHTGIVPGTISFLLTLVDVCPQERIKEHRYDFLGLALVVFERFSYEEKFDDNLLDQLRTLIRACSLTPEDIERLENFRPKTTVLFIAAGT